MANYVRSQVLGLNPIVVRCPATREAERQAERVRLGSCAFCEAEKAMSLDGRGGLALPPTVEHDQERLRVLCDAPLRP